MNADMVLKVLSRFGDHPDRIREFRKVVVGLAIAGRLEGDSHSQSTIELFASVEEQKAKSVACQNLSKPKNHPSVLREQLPDPFTDPGSFVALGTIAQIEKGLTGIKQAIPGPFPLVVTSAERSSCNHFDFDGAAVIIPLVSSTGHGNASINRLHYQEGKFALGTILAAVIPFAPSLISARFLYEYLSTFKQELLVSRMTGTANVTLSIGRIAEVPVPLICPSVQRIVDKIMTMCDQLEVARAEREASRDKLTTVSLARLNAPGLANFNNDVRFVIENFEPLTTRIDQIKQFRQTIRSLAVRGKLHEQSPQDEPASKLVERFAAERAKLIKAGRTSRRKPAAAISPAEYPYAVPPGWAWDRLANAAIVKQGFAFASSDFSQSPDDGYPLIKIGDIGGDQPNTYVKGNPDLRYLVCPGEILLGLSGSIKTAVWMGPEALLNQRIAKISPVSADLLTPWLFLTVQAQIENWKAETSKLTVQNIKADQLSNALIPLPPAAEQRRIVAKVDELMVLCDQLEASLTIGERTCSRLLEATLHRTLEAA